jgi:hypothetical protein
VKRLVAGGVQGVTPVTGRTATTCSLGSGQGDGALATAQALQGRGPTSSTLSAGVFTLCGHISAYGRCVSGAMENRAAVFTSQPQAVEVYQAGAWWAGELLGWRHDANGSCQVWVRVVLGGVEETAWTDLSTLRLPERHLSVAAEPASPRAAAYAPETQAMSVARHPSGRRARTGQADESSTAGLPLTRDLSVVRDVPATGGRRTADETAQFASVGRRRAPEAPAPSAGGRRRAPDTGETPAVGRRRAADFPTPADAGAAGRHRAPAADVGRHRTADTGLFPVVRDAESVRPQPPRASRPAPAVHASRPDGALEARSRESWTASTDPEPELLTRPMRLSDQLPHARRPRVDGTFTSV